MRDALLKLLVEAESTAERRAMAEAIDGNFAALASRDRMLFMLCIGLACCVVGLAIALAVQAKRQDARWAKLDKLGNLRNVP